jgi:hypothetical protein
LETERRLELLEAIFVSLQHSGCSLLRKTSLQCISGLEYGYYSAGANAEDFEATGWDSADGLAESLLQEVVAESSNAENRRAMLAKAD